MPQEELETLGSTAIASAIYDTDEQTLVIEFTNGDFYHWPDVPVGVWRRFQEASSKGAFFNRYIRGVYGQGQVLGPQGWWKFNKK